MTMTPEEEFNQEVWDILQKVKFNHLFNHLGGGIALTPRYVSSTLRLYACQNDPSCNESGISYLQQNARK